MESITGDFFRIFFRESRIGIWLGVLRHPMPADLSKRRQYLHISGQGYLARCNKSFAAAYGITNPRILSGVSLGQLFCHSSLSENDLLRQFVLRHPQTHGIFSCEAGQDDNNLWFENSCFGVYEAGKLVRVWGKRKVVTEHQRREIERGKKLTTLTASQLSILEMTVQGKTLKEMGSALSLSVNTIESYRMRALRKLDIPSVSELIRRSMLLGLGLTRREEEAGGAGSNVLSW